jgi:preprotein translocase subunit Sec63
MKNPYETLGVSTDISLSELKKVYRKLCRQYHPDNNNGDANKFAEISKAYDMIVSGVYAPPSIDTIIHEGLFRYKVHRGLV